MSKGKNRLDRTLFPQQINSARTGHLTEATCGFINYPQITTLLTTTSFINTKGWE